MNEKKIACKHTQQLQAQGKNWQKCFYLHVGQTSTKNTSNKQLNVKQAVYNCWVNHWYASLCY